MPSNEAKGTILSHWDPRLLDEFSDLEDIGKHICRRGVIAYCEGLVSAESPRTNTYIDLEAERESNEITLGAIMDLEKAAVLAKMEVDQKAARDKAAIDLALTELKVSTLLEYNTQVAAQRIMCDKVEEKDGRRKKF